MEDKQIIDRLTELMQLDFDAARSYEQALKQIDIPRVNKQITEFLNDHERHVENLADCLRQLGVNPPALSRDLKGFLIEGFTVIRSITGNEGALKALESNEKMVNNRYKEAVMLGYPVYIKNIVEDNYNDEKRHLDYIVRSLEARVWEEEPEIEPVPADLYDQIRLDHINILSIFDELQELDQSDNSARQELFNSLSNQLSSHMKAEEDVWYTAMKEKAQSRRYALKTTQEHSVAKFILSELHSKSINDENWSPQLVVLRNVFELHIGDEESESFAISNSVFSLEELEQMGRSFQAVRSSTEDNYPQAA